jgi:antitoxin VapB
MGLNIKNPEVEKAVKALAKARGTSLTDAIGDAVNRELDWIYRRKNLARDIKQITEKIRPVAHLIPSSDQIDALLYDEMGLPK